MQRGPSLWGVLQFSLFSLQVLEKLDLEVLDFGIFSELAIGQVFDLAYQTCKNICTFICIFIGIFNVFIVLSYFYENTYIRHCKTNEVTYVAHIPQVVLNFTSKRTREKYNVPYCSKHDLRLNEITSKDVVLLAFFKNIKQLAIKCMSILSSCLKSMQCEIRQPT